MSSTAVARLRQGYVAGLLSGLRSLRDMVAAGLVGFSLSHSCRLMKQAELEAAWKKRLVAAPRAGYLAVDFVKLKHESKSIEGVDRQYTNEGILWGHRFLTSALVFTDGQDPHMVRADAAPSKLMATEDTPYLKPVEAMLSVVGHVLVSGYDLKAVVVDAKFTSKRKLTLPAALSHRYRRSL